MKLVDIIIPTYNRARYLEETIPTYVQDDVLNIFIIDDGSTDDTMKVCENLLHIYPQIIYRRLKRGGRQMAAKNLGISLSKAKYVYFGDDDSIITKGTIAELLKMSEANSDHIVASRHIYLKQDEIMDEKINFYSKKVDAELIYSSSTMNLNLGYEVPSTINLPFCQSCFMIRAEIAKKVKFDIGYLGTSFREESDYIISLRKLGYGLVVCNAAMQINLPKVKGKGGTSSVLPAWRHVSEIVNEYRFFKKHGDFLVQFVKFSVNPAVRAFAHFAKKIKSLIRLVDYAKK